MGNGTSHSGSLAPCQHSQIDFIGRFLGGEEPVFFPTVYGFPAFAPTLPGYRGKRLEPIGRSAPKAMPHGYLGTKISRFWCRFVHESVCSPQVGSRLSSACPRSIISDHMRGASWTLQCLTSHAAAAAEMSKAASRQAGLVGQTELLVLTAVALPHQFQGRYRVCLYPGL